MWDNKFDELIRKFLPFLPEGEQLTASAPLREFGLDSMAVVELLSVLEKEYDVRFDDESLTLDTFETPGTLWTALSGLQPAN